MNLVELRKLAEAAQHPSIGVRAKAQQDLVNENIPATILALLALIDEMAAALKAWERLELDEQQCDVVLKKYKELTNG